MRALLDVNVLLALFDSNHADHLRARSWLTREIRHGWASCALTQNGFVRIISQPRYPGSISPAEAILRLRQATATEHHEFWSCEVSVLDAQYFEARRIHGPKQVTDLYLLALAVHHGGRLVTFDDRIPLSAVPHATPRHLAVV